VFSVGLFSHAGVVDVLMLIFCMSYKPV